MPTIEDVMNLPLTAEQAQLFERFSKVLAGQESTDTVSLREFVSTPQAQILIPKVIVGAMRQAAEPLYLGTKLLKRIRTKVTNGTVVFPYVGPMRAYDVAEGQEVPEDVIDVSKMTTPEIRVGKSGVRVRITQELIDDSQWDIVALLVEAAGRAMARHKEQKIFNAIVSNGHTVFDNAIRHVNPEAGTRGLDFYGKPNNTLSVEDLLDLIISVMANEFTPTDLLMHSLVWPVFARNGLVGSLGHAPESPVGGGYKLGPDSVQGRIPFAFNVQLSPFMNINKENKTFDIVAVDRNNIGTLLVREDMRVDQFDEPARDIKNIKVIERYGIGIFHQGRAIATAKNISMEKSYPELTRTATADLNSVGPNPLP